MQAKILLACLVTAVAGLASFEAKADSVYIGDREYICQNTCQVTITGGSNGSYNYTVQDSLGGWFYWVIR